MVKRENPGVDCQVLAPAPILIPMTFRIFLNLPESQFLQLGFICKKGLLKFLSREVLVKRKKTQ